jgi:hypothetical protein
MRWAAWLLLLLPALAQAEPATVAAIAEFIGTVVAEYGGVTITVGNVIVAAQPGLPQRQRVPSTTPACKTAQ